MANDENVTFSVTLPKNEALAYAQFLKRASYSDYLKRSTSGSEAALMIIAGEAIREGLEEAGIAPR